MVMFGMMKVNYKEQFTVTMELKQGNSILGYHLRETWQNSKGEVSRSGELPPIVGYDPETGRRIYRAWPNINGSLVQRDNGKPCEIYETEDQPHAKWRGRSGVSTFIAWAKEVHRNPKTGEIDRIEFDEPKQCFPSDQLPYPPNFDF